MPADHDPDQPSDQPSGQPPGPVRPGTGDGDVDPTGVRDLLAALPDPGPMPDDLVRRIEARLDVERASLKQRAPAGQGPRGGRVVDLAAERGRRRPAPTIALVGSAAAGLVAAAIVVPQLLDGPLGSGDSGVAAHYPARDRTEMSDTGAGRQADSADDAADADAAQDAGDDAAAAGGDEAESGRDAAEADMASEEGASAATGDSGVGAMAQEDATEADTAPSEVIGLVPLDGELVLLPELGPVDQQDLTDHLLSALAEHRTGDRTEHLLPGGLTEGEALSCWQELSARHSFDRYAAARAQLVDGERPAQDAVALLGVDEDGSGRSWLMPERCTVDASVDPLVEGVPRN